MTSNTGVEWLLEAMMIASLAWINANGPYEEVPLEECCPTIIVQDGESFVYQLLGPQRHYKKMQTNPKWIEYHSSAAGLYFHGRNLIFINSDHAHMSTDPMFQVVLLHEMVHWVQDVSGAWDDYECSAATERTAYELQRDWLVEQGHDPWPNDLTIWMRSMCDAMQPYER